MECSCEKCGNVPECQHAFGAFWNDKSGGGKGCRHPFRPAWRVADLPKPEPPEPPRPKPWERYVREPAPARLSRDELRRRLARVTA